MKARNERGFTLIELIIVIVIIGILAAVAVPKFLDLSDSAKAANCKANQAAVESAGSIGYAHFCTDAAHADVYPTQAEIVSEGFLAAFPVCPGTGTLSYDQATGLASCTVHTR